MAWRRASFTSLVDLRSSRSALDFVLGAASSGSLHAGQRLAKPGLSGLSSNSSEQTAQTRIGNAIKPLFYNLCRPALHQSHLPDAFNPTAIPRDCSPSSPIIVTR